MPPPLLTQPQIPRPCCKSRDVKVVGYIGYELSRSRVATNMCTYRHAVTHRVALNLYPFALYRAPSACCSQQRCGVDNAASLPLKYNTKVAASAKSFLNVELS